MKNSDILILIDNGHGYDTPGKCSPDRRLLEWKWNREVAQRISRTLSLAGYNARLLVPEENDIKLKERVRRVNAYCAKYGAKNVVLVSIHVNAAASDDKWHNASGFSIFVAPNASDRSKRLAKAICTEFMKAELMGNRCVPIEKYWIGDFAIIRDTACPAVLTENHFQDNISDVEYLLSEEGKQETTELTVNGIVKYLNSLQ